MMSPPSSRGGLVSASTASSPSMTSVPSKRRSKASPSDVIFGQPPGSDEAVHSLGPLSTDSSPSSRPTSSRKRPHPRTSSPASAPSSSTSPRTTRGPPGEADAAAGAASRTVPGDVVDGVKTLPSRLDDASTDDILVLVGDMLLRLMTHNDSLPLHPSSLTRFHSRATPGISIQSYLRRIAKYTSLDKACLLILLVYIDRVCERVKGFTICSLTVHRFVCAAVVCATKALCDAFSTNGHYARVGGISLVELNMLEKEFLSIIDWHLTCSGALLQHYYASLVSSHPSYALEEGRGGGIAGEEAGPSSSSSSSSSNEGSEASEGEAEGEADEGGSIAANGGDMVKPSAGALAEEPYMGRKHSHRHHHHHRRDNGDAAPALEADRVAQQRANAGGGAEASAMEE